MADWEDDDFGGFESADLGSVPAAETASLSNSDLLSQTTSPVAGSTGATQVLDWILSNTPKSEASANVIDTTGGVIPFSLDGDKTAQSAAQKDERFGRQLEERSEGEFLQQQTQGSDALQDALGQASVTSVSSLADGEVGLSEDAGEAKLSMPATLNEVKQASPQYTESKTAIQALAAEDAKMEINRQENALQDLQAKLDAAIVVKEQTEKTLEKLQEELKSLTDRRKKELEEKDKEHVENIEMIKKQHFEEIKGLQRTSEDTAKMISKQYAQVWKLFEKEKETEVEMNANMIVDKCSEILMQQQAVLSQKLEDDRLLREKEVQKTLMEEKKKMWSELETKLAEERDEMQLEMNEHFKAELAKEINRLEEVHAATLREAMSNQQALFEDSLKSTLGNERDKFTERLNAAVEKAQLDTEKSLLERRKLEEVRTRNHAMSMRMFLTSALKQLDSKFSDGVESEGTEDDVQTDPTV